MLWLHSLKVAQLLRSAACLHTNQSRSYLKHLVFLSELESLLHDCFPLHSFMIPPSNQAHARNDIKTLTTSFIWRFINRCCFAFDVTDVPHHSIIHSLLLDCITTGLQPLFVVRRTTFSFNFQQPLLSLRFSSSCLPLLPSLRVTSIFIFFLQ